MSLSVSLFFRDPLTEKVVRIEDPEDSPQLGALATLGGFESWRKKLWGS